MLIALFLLEIGLRYVGGNGTDYMTVDDVLGWRYLPRAAYRVFDGDGCPGWDSEGRINSHGLRDSEHDYAKPAHTFRILALGDGFTSSIERPLEETWPRLLERLLNGRHDGVRYEVINAGREGAGTVYEYLYYLTEGHRYSPDVVIVLTTGTEMLRNSKALRAAAHAYSAYEPYFDLVGNQLILDNRFNRSWAYRLRKITMPLREHSALIASILRLSRWVRNPHAKFARSHSPAGASGASEVSRSESVQAVVVTQRLLIELRRAVEASGARPVVFNGARDIHFDRNQPGVLLAALSREKEILSYDLVPFLEDYAARTHEYVIGCVENHGVGHYSPTGHVQVARVMYDFLSQSGLLRGISSGQSSPGPRKW